MTVIRDIAKQLNFSATTGTYSSKQVWFTEGDLENQYMVSSALCEWQALPERMNAAQRLCASL